MTAPPRQTTRVRGEPASWRESGRGPAVILAAGLGLSSRFYEHSYPAFAAAGLRLIVPDLPGWGETPGPLSGVAPEQSAEFLIEFSTTLKVSRAVWIGHSLGAQAVAEVAARRPDMAAGIVLVGPTGAPGRLQLLRQASGLTVEAGRTSAGVIGAVAREYIRTPPTRYLGTWIRHARHDLLEVLPRVHCPALVLVGDRDPVCRPEFIALLHDRLPAAQVAWVRGGTHALPRGHAEAFNRLATAFARAQL